MYILYLSIFEKCAVDTLCPCVPQAEHEGKPRSKDEGPSAAAVSCQNLTELRTPPRRRYLPPYLFPSASGSAPPLPPPSMSPPREDDQPTPDYRHRNGALQRVKEEPPPTPRHRDGALQRVKEEPPPTPQKSKKQTYQPAEEGPKLAQVVKFGVGMSSNR